MLRASPLNLETSLRALLAEDLSLALDQALLDTAAADSTRPAGLRSGVAGLTAAASCSRTYIGKLEAEGVIQRQGDGFPLDQSRVAYLRYLRRERRQSPRSEADADFQRAKSELIRLRIAEKHGT